MNEIRIIGQAISSTNYATKRLFDFNPEPVRDAARNFLACGVSEIEIPEGVLDPDNTFPDAGLDEAALKRTLEMLPSDTRVIASYMGPGTLGEDNEGFLRGAMCKIDNLTRYFPDMMQTMIHPPHVEGMGVAEVKQVVDAWAELARYAASVRPGFQCCLHNHYDSSCETATQLRMYLDALGEADEPALRWGPDTGHTHGAGEDYLAIFEQYAPLIGNHFHIKARVPAFDQRHEPDRYRPDRDIWGNKAEFGSGLYGGFVNCADPEIETPFEEVFDIIRRKARPVAGVVTGAIEIDNPRQHPRLEVLCSVLYLKCVHGLQPAITLSCEEIVQRVFRQED